MNFDAQKAKLQIGAEEFKRTNGIVIRTINLMFQTKWFRLSDLFSALHAYQLKKDDIYDALDYLEGRCYIKARDIENKGFVEVIEADAETTEIKLIPDGKLVALALSEDAGVDI